MSVDVVMEDPRWEIADLCDLAVIACSATLSHVGLVADEWDIAVLACDDPHVSGLNAQFRGKEVATNVLSWPSEERAAKIEGERPFLPSGDPELGNIAIAYDTCVKEANDGSLTLRDHTTHLLVHGTLHLLGYDHERDGDGDLMEATEIAILAKLGVPNPYIG